MNLKKAKKLRQLIGVIVHSRREYQDGRGDHHRFPTDGQMAGGIVRRSNVRWKFPRFPGTVTLAKGSHRAQYQRIKRKGLIDAVLNGQADAA